MSTIGDRFVSQFHAAHLKTRGFKKKARRTFFRSHEGFTEYFQIQGSAWNDSETPWTFYLNCGIRFDGFPPRNPDRDFPGTHAWARAGVFTTSARPQYDLTSDNLIATAAQIAEVILQCSEYFQRRHAVLRYCFEGQRYRGAFLADPEL